MPNIPRCKRRDVIRALTSYGYALDHRCRSGRGGHDVYMKDGYPSVSVPRHRLIKPGVVRSLCKALRVDPLEFLSRM